MLFSLISLRLLHLHLLKLLHLHLMLHLHLLVVLVHLRGHGWITHQWEAREVLQALRLFHGRSSQMWCQVRPRSHGAHVHLLLHVRGHRSSVQVPQRLHVRLFAGLVLAWRGLFLRLILEQLVVTRSEEILSYIHIGARIVVVVARTGSIVRARV
jgi:hypothetical protein